MQYRSREKIKKIQKLHSILSRKISKSNLHLYQNSLNPNIRRLLEKQLKQQSNYIHNKSNSKNITFINGTQQLLPKLYITNFQNNQIQSKKKYHPHTIITQQNKINTPTKFTLTSRNHHITKNYFDYHQQYFMKPDRKTKFMEAINKVVLEIPYSQDKNLVLRRSIMIDQQPVYKFSPKLQKNIEKQQISNKQIQKVKKRQTFNVTLHGRKKEINNIIQNSELMTKYESISKIPKVTNFNTIQDTIQNGNKMTIFQNRENQIRKHKDKRRGKNNQDSSKDFSPWMIEQQV